jgi:hypothetical protein
VVHPDIADDVMISCAYGGIKSNLQVHALCNDVHREHIHGTIWEMHLILMDIQYWITISSSDWLAISIALPCCNFSFGHSPHS